MVLGIGNTLRKDDGVGIIIVEFLEEQLNGYPNLFFETMQTGGVDILSSIDKFDFAIIVDAAIMDTEPGFVSWINYQQPQEGTRLYSSTHSAGVLETLQLAQKIPGLDCPKHLAVLGIQVETIEGFGEELSPSVAEGASNAIKMVLDQLKKWKIISQEIKVNLSRFQRMIMDS